MAWLESHQALADHPKTRKLMRILGIGKPAAIGHLHCLWWWALDYADDGDLSRYDALDIAIGAEWDGEPDDLVAALVQAGFLDRDGDTLTIHDWDDYAGKLVIKRRQNAQRMRDARAKHGASSMEDDPATYDERAMHVPGTQRARATLHNTTVPTEQNTTDRGANAPAPVPLNRVVKGDTPAHEIVNAFYGVIGGKSAAPAKDLGIAKNLVNAGITPEDVEPFVAWAREDWAGREGVDLGVLVRSVTRWRSTKAQPPDPDLIEIPDDLFGQARLEYARAEWAKRQAAKAGQHA